MELRVWKVDAFAERPFEGNPAAVIPLSAWLSDDLMQAVAMENNLSETAFFVPEPERGPGHFHLRWFTPAVEVPLCGHATLASAYVVFEHLKTPQDRVVFRTLSGDLAVTRTRTGALAMDLPSYDSTPRADADSFAHALEAALGRKPIAVFKANYPLAVFDVQADVAALRPGAGLSGVLAQFGESGLIATAKSAISGFDFVTRFFAPGKGIAEDPVTGSAHCAAAPFWARRLGKDRLIARQISERGGTLDCTVTDGRVAIAGRCVLFLEGTIFLQM
jgi:PhzF family phenazine biosynthesis protein